MPDQHAPVALVTGASRGIGRAIVQALSSAGYRVAGVSRPVATNPDKIGSRVEDAPRTVEGPFRAAALDQLAGEIGSRGGAFLPIPAAVADLSTHARVVEAVAAAFGPIDLFVGNAGIAPSPRLDVLEMTPESFDRVLGVNLRGNVFLAQRVARAMIDARAHSAEDVGPGRAAPAIVFITSQSARLASVERAEYCISKAAASMAARVLAVRLASAGINVFEVRPGIIRTDMTAPVAAKYDAAIAKGAVPQGRWGEPEDVARLVVALARGDLGYSTGAVIDVDGGLALPRM